MIEIKIKNRTSLDGFNWWSNKLLNPILSIIALQKNAVLRAIITVEKLCMHIYNFSVETDNSSVETEDKIVSNKFQQMAFNKAHIKFN